MLDFNEIRAKYPIDQISEKKKKLEESLTDSSAQGKTLSQISAELKYATALYDKYTLLHSFLDQLDQAYEISNDEDEEISAMGKQEATKLEKDIATSEEEIKSLEISHQLADPDDMKSVILEIRAGAGGDEASLFAADLYRMYLNFANSKGWKMDMVDSSLNDSGGFKEVIAYIKGEAVYESLKYESGVHRVQRIPTTESGGRIHTSTVSVAILPEAAEIDVEIKQEDLRIDTMRASGAGGQKVNKTSSAIRITHIPTGIVVSCQDTKVQQQNKEKAMQILRARLYEREREQQHDKRSKMRSLQIGSAMRAEKIRTYNYPQSRITDHRIKKSWHDLEGILNGEISELLTETDESFKEMMLEELRSSAD